MATKRSCLVFLAWLISHSMVLCEEHGLGTQDNPTESLLRRVSVLEDRDANQQEINMNLQTELDLEKKSSAELRAGLLQLKRDNSDMQEALDTQGKLIDTLKESLAKRDTVHLEMVQHLQNELLDQRKRCVNDQRLPKKNLQTVDVQNDDSETVPTKQYVRKAAVRNLPRIRQVETEEVTIAFSAGLNHTLSNIGMDQNIVFDDVEINTGNGYNSHHGIFVAPASGTYVLHTTIYASHSKGSSQLYCHFVVNGNRKSGLFVESDPSVSSTGSQMMITRLHKGDDVSVQIGIPVAYLKGSVDLYSTFSGFLLAQDSSPVVVG